MSGRTVIIFCLLYWVSQVEGTQPNIILIVFDDVGVHDVSWNNPLAKTPVLENLAKNGIILDNAYTLPSCTPSRAAILTGVYPYKMGLQRGFGTFFPDGIPTSIPLLPEYLKKQGYMNHIFGKWHLGFCSEQYTPAGRGFDSFDGLYVSMKQYEKLNRTLETDHMTREQLIKHIEKKTRDKMKGKLKMENVEKYSLNEQRKRPSEITSKHYFDKMKTVLANHDESKPFFFYLGLFTKYYNKYKDLNIIKDRPKILKNMDDTIGKIVDLLKESDLYNNTIIFFVSDNGGREMPNNVPSPNYPLRGYKGSIYEGGTKVPAFIHSPLLNNSGHRYQGLFHSTDIMPTLLHAAGADLDNQDIDGLTQWTAIGLNTSSPRTKMVYNIDDETVPARLDIPGNMRSFQICVREGKYKLIWGTKYMLVRHYRKLKTRGEEEEVELFDLDNDPGETENIADIFPDVVRQLKQFGLQNYENMIPPAMGIKNWVIIPSSPVHHGSVTGWCRPVVRTECTAGRIEKRDGWREVSDKKILHGSIESYTFVCQSELV